MTRPASRRRSGSAPLGVAVFGLGLILTSLLQMAGLVQFDRYRYLLQDLPASLLMARYALSWLIRVVGLAAGIGILLRKGLCRQVIIALEAATIMIVHWKHPYESVARLMHDLRLQFRELAPFFELLQPYGIGLSTLTWITVIVIRLQEIALACLLIWYFTRPRVKDWFARQPTRESAA